MGIGNSLYTSSCNIMQKMFAVSRMNHIQYAPMIKPNQNPFLGSGQVSKQMSGFA